jgi:RHS repeat-associated protein
LIYDAGIHGNDAVTRSFTFKYDPFGRRIYKSSSSGTSIFAYDGDNLVEETNSSGAAVARYEPTQNIDEPLAMLRSGATSYFHADGLGSITSLSSAAGSIANTYTYDSFGKLTASTGSLVNPFLYTAHESDSETGLYYYRARYYDQIAGRFISEDPARLLGGSLNFYKYARNNPARLKDPLGLFTIGATINFNLQLGPITIVGSAGVALDNHGNFGITLAPGGGVGVGLNSSVTLSLQASNAKTICDLRGPFNNLSAGAGAGLDASLDSFYGTSDNGPVAGFGVGLGVGAGAGASTTITTTTVKPTNECSCPN